MYLRSTRTQIISSSNIELEEKKDEQIRNGNDKKKKVRRIFQIDIKAFDCIIFFVYSFIPMINKLYYSSFFIS